jgi:serine/threonine-protein kinase
VIPAGTAVGEYTIEYLLGVGGFGAVYRAVQPLIGKAVAIKVLNRACSANPQVVSRFIAEARAVNQIQHRNIIDIFGFGQLGDGRHYYVMELLNGQPMDAWLGERGPIPLAQMLPILRPLARALDAAHAKGIAHRDLKPENVFLVRDPSADPDDPADAPFPKLLDFGIAKLLDPEAREHADHRTHTGTPIGTPAYMSPEQCKGRDVDHRTDIYSFGVMVFRMLTGQLPFTGGGFMEIAFKQMSEAPPRPSSIVPVPAGLDERVLWFLEKDAARRPATLAAGVRALEDLRAPLASVDAAPLGASREMPPLRAATPSFIGEAATIGAEPAPPLQPMSAPGPLAPAITLPAAPAPAPSRAPLVIGGVLVAAGIAAGVFFAGRAPEPTPVPAAAPTQAPTAAPTLAPTATPPTAAPSRNERAPASGRKKPGKDDIESF